MSTVMVPNRPMFSLCAGGHVGEYLLVDPAALATELVDREPQVLRPTSVDEITGIVLTLAHHGIRSVSALRMLRWVSRHW
jgi:hypothetical protein